MGEFGESDEMLSVGGAEKGTKSGHLLVESFIRRLIEAMDEGYEVQEVLDAIDPDPARYTDIDEGGGVLPEVLRPADALLKDLKPLAGYRRINSSRISESSPTARPALARTETGFVIAAIRWIEGAGEQILVEQLGRDGESLDESVSVSGTPGDCLRPSVVTDADGEPWVFYGYRRNQVMGVWYVRHDSEGWSQPKLLSTPGVSAFNQEVTVHSDGQIECCYQELVERRFAVVTKRFSSGVWSKTERLSLEDERNVWDPVLVALPDGGSCYAWTSYGDSGYVTAVLLRRPSDSDRRFVLSDETGYSLHPSLAVTDDGTIWCASDRVILGGHGGSGPTRLRSLEDLGKSVAGQTKADGRAIPADLSPNVTADIQVYTLSADSDQWYEQPRPGAMHKMSPSALPKLCVVDGSQVVVAYRIIRRLPLMLYYWEGVVQVFESGDWTGPVHFEGGDGPLEEVALASNSDVLAVAWKEDGRREQSLEWQDGFGGAERPELREHYGEVIWNTVDRPGGIRVGTLPVVATSPAEKARRVGELRTLAEFKALPPKVGSPYDRPWVVARNGQKAERYTTKVGDNAYSLYWGDLHRHSLISRCTAGDEPTLDDFYHYAWDVCEYDFWAVTDHAENTSTYQWAMIQKIADVLHIPDVFVPFYGFEWTGGTGHQNVIYESLKRGVPIFSSSAKLTEKPDGLWKHLHELDDQRVITIPHHPGSAMVPFDWNYRDDALMRLVEIFQACRGNYEMDGCFRQYSDGTLANTFVIDGLKRGHRFGFIASSDHGNGASYVGAFADSLDRKSIFSALHDRRTIAATTRDIVLDVRLNDAFMGSETGPTDEVKIDVHARGYTDVARVDIVRDGETVKTFQPEIDLPNDWISVPLRIEWTNLAVPTIDWSGGLRLYGDAKVVLTPYWSPEIVEVGEDFVRWSAHTRNFSSQYGAQRGGVEMTVIGRPDAILAIDLVPGGSKVELGSILSDRGVTILDDGKMRLVVQPGTGGLQSMKTTDFSTTWQEAITEDHAYYVRLFLVDGEMAWSSPVWVTSNK